MRRQCSYLPDGVQKEVNDPTDPRGSAGSVNTGDKIAESTEPPTKEHGDWNWLEGVKVPRRNPCQSDSPLKARQDHKCASANLPSSTKRGAFSDIGRQKESILPSFRKSTPRISGDVTIPPSTLCTQKPLPVE